MASSLFSETSSFLSLRSVIITPCAKLFNRLFQKYFQKTRTTRFDQHVGSIAGGMFWFRMGKIDVDLLWNTASETDGLPHDRTKNCQERFFPSFFTAQSLKIQEIIPAPLPVVFYHAENPKILLNNNKSLIREPLSITKGGLGFYDVFRLEIRKKQGEMAKKFGIYAFVYDFEDHKFLERVVKEGHPKLPFLLCWDFSLNQNGHNPKKEWEERFDSLFNYFQLKKYVKIWEKPVLILKNFEKIENIEQMVYFWENRSKKLQLPKIKIIIPRKENDHTTNDKIISGAYYFQPQKKENEPSKNKQKKLQRKKNNDQYWGGVTDKNPKEFSNFLQDSFLKMSLTPGRTIDFNFFFLDSWNGWREQVVLEPDSLYGTSLLDSLQSSLQHLPLSQECF